jgi:hypothetical protein
MYPLKYVVPVAFVVALTCGCTSMGHHAPVARQNLDFGPPLTLNLCLYLDNGVSEEYGRTLIRKAWNHEGALYGIDLQVVQVRSWARPAFEMDGILHALRQQPLDAPCDRILALVGRNVGDFLWSLFGPEVLGAVNDETLTHGYAAARVASFNQLAAPPADVVRHEIYHLLGCGEHFDMTRCYERIAYLKQWKQANGGDFYPAWDLVNGRMLATREAVNARLEPLRTAAVAAR